jgi:hypothetical protein
VTACVCSTVPFSSAGLFPTSHWTLLPSNASSGIGLLRLASRLRQVLPGPSPLPPPWLVAPSWVKFCILAIGLTPQLTSGFITPSKVRFSFFGFRFIDSSCLYWCYIALADQPSCSQQTGREGPHWSWLRAEREESQCMYQGHNAFLHILHTM